VAVASAGPYASLHLAPVSCQSLQCHAFSALTLLVGWQEGHLACKKTEWWGACVVICLERGADLHMAQLMSLPLTVSCFSEIQIGFSFLVPAHLGSPGKRAVKRVCVCVCLFINVWSPNSAKKICSIDLKFISANYVQNCFACVKMPSASGVICLPNSLLGLCPWTPLVTGGVAATGYFRKLVHCSSIDVHVYFKPF